jgi:spore coat protein U-like protein
MNATLKTSLLSSIFAFSVLGVAHGSTNVGQFEVKMSVNGSCEVGVPAAIDFGTVNAGALVAAKTGTLTVRCTAGENPKITLASGNSWKMVGTGAGSQGNNAGQKVGYRLYFGSGATQPWDETNAVAVTGTGIQTELAIFATAEKALYSGVYADTVTVSLTF